MRITSVGHAAFAAVIILIGTLGLIRTDLATVWQPPASMPWHETLAYLFCTVSLASGLGLLWRRGAVAAANVLIAALLLSIVLLRVPGMVRAPAEIARWENCGEAVVMLAGAWALRAALAGGKAGPRIARVLYGLAMLAFGAAHFAYIKDTASLVPAWLPAHLFWVYFTGGAYLAAGAALLCGVLARLAATLSVAQMGLFTLLVWLPIVAAPGHKDAFLWSEAVISTALTVAGWVVAESYRGTPWFGRAP